MDEARDWKPQLRAAMSRHSLKPESDTDKHCSNYQDAKPKLFFTFLSRQITPELVL